MRNFLLVMFLAATAAITGLAQTPAAAAPVGNDPVILAAGDIARCSEMKGPEAVAKLLDANPGTILALGDLAYPDGTDEQFANCYGKTWGRHKDRTKPAPGNHEWHTKDAAGYAHYWNAPTPDRYWYSFDLGAWHIVALDSDCFEKQKETGGCEKGSPEEAWLRADLAAHPAKCTLAYFHHPRFSTGDEHGDNVKMTPLWETMYAAGVDVILNGHDHDYERFAPQSPAGKADTERGIREFVVGTGGANLRGFQATHSATSEVRSVEAHGVLKLTLHADSYDWEFLPEAGKTFTDKGKGSCH